MVAPGITVRSAQRDASAIASRGDDWLARLSTPRAWVLWVGVSAAIGIALAHVPLLSTIHMIVVLVAVAGVGISTSHPASVLAVTLYAGVCDVLWRATGASGPWEAGKYAIVLGAGCLLVRFAPRARGRLLPAAMLALLVPGAVLTIMRLGPLEGRGYVASNLAGWVAIAALAAACTSLRLTATELRGLYLIVLGPIVALAASATWGTIQARDLTWTEEVNFATSAGFGPNQVSSLLGLGALLCVLVTIQPGVTRRGRILAFATGVWLVGQMVLTFSRGGVFGLVLALAGLGLVSLLTSGQRTRTVVAASLVVVAGIQIMSWAGAFTDGASEERFSSTDSTNRWGIASADLELFWEHPLLGVGAGMAKYDRAWSTTAAHTEFTRLPGEHGLLGVGVVALLAAFCLRLVMTNQGWYRMATVGLLITVLTQMTHSATRVGAIAVAVGLASLREDQL